MQYLIAFLLGMTSVHVFEWIEESYRESSRASHDRKRLKNVTRTHGQIAICASAPRKRTQSSVSYTCIKLWKMQKVKVSFSFSYCPPSSRHVCFESLLKIEFPFENRN